MRGNISLRAILVLSMAVAILAITAAPASAEIVIDGFDNWIGGNPVPGTFDASGSDKLVVIVTGEHGFNQTANGYINGVTYDGVAMVELINRTTIKKVADDPGTPEDETVLVDDTWNAIYYLDNPGSVYTAGSIEASVSSRGSMTVLGLSGTALGAGNTVIGDRDTSSAELTTPVDSIDIASYGMGGTGNTAFINKVTVDTPLTFVSKQNNGGGRWWDGHVTAYANGVAAERATYSVTDTSTPGADGRTGAHVIAAAFELAVPTLYWDLNGATPGTGGATPSGTWDDANTYWNTDYTGGADGSVGAWSTDYTARFGAGTDANGAYIVTVEGTKDITGLYFEEGTVTLQEGTAGAIRMTSDSSVYAASGATATIEIPISDDGSDRRLYAACDGTLTLSGDLTHTGGTAVFGKGMLTLSGNNVAATGGMTVESAVQFESLASINGTSRDVAVNAGGVVVFGSPFVDANIPTALSDRIVADSEGTIAADNHGATNFDLDTPGLTAAYFGAVGNVTYTATLTPNGTTYRLGGGGGTLTMANTNAVTGTGFNLIVGGNVTLAGANDYDGGTALDAGTLAIGDDGSLGSGTLTFNDGGIASDSAANHAIANDVAFTADGSLGDAVNTGKLTFTNSADLGGATRILTLNSDAEFSGVISGSGGGLTTAGTGVLTLSGSNTYDGATSFGGGTAVVSGSSSTSGVTLRAGTLVVGNAAGLGSGTFTVTGGTLETQGAITISNNVTVGGNLTIGGTGELTVDGTTTLNNHRNVYNNNTTTATTFGDISSSNKTVYFRGDGDTTVTGAIATGSGQVLKYNAGTLTLEGVNTYTGNTTVNGGTLVLDGSCDSSAVIVNNNTKITGGGSVKGLTISAGAGYTWGYGDGGDHVMDVGDALSLAEAWVLELVDLGDDPQGSQKYDLFTFTGNFNGSPVAGPITLVQDTDYTVDANSALDWDVDGIDIVVAAAATTGFRVYVTGIGVTMLPGDADENGVVNAADYMALKRHMGMGSGATLAMGNFDGDNDVDYDDLQLLIGNYGETSAGAGTIPEPATLFVMMAAGLPALLKRRRRRS